MHMEAGKVLAKEIQDNRTKYNRIDHHLKISIFKVITGNLHTKRIMILKEELMSEIVERSQELVEGTAWAMWSLS
jgi:hypothetical protein